MNRLKEIRKQEGFTQVELGKEVGKYQSFIHNIERCYYFPTEKEKQELAQALGVSIPDIFPDASILG